MHWCYKRYPAPLYKHCFLFHGIYWILFDFVQVYLPLQPTCLGQIANKKKTEIMCKYRTLSFCVISWVFLFFSLSHPNLFILFQWLDSRACHFWLINSQTETLTRGKLFGWLWLFIGQLSDSSPFLIKTVMTNKKILHTVIVDNMAPTHATSLNVSPPMP